MNLLEWWWLPILLAFGLGWGVGYRDAMLDSNECIERLQREIRRIREVE